MTPHNRMSGRSRSCRRAAASFPGDPGQGVIDHELAQITQAARVGQDAALSPPTPGIIVALTAHATVIRLTQP